MHLVVTWWATPPAGVCDLLRRWPAALVGLVCAACAGHGMQPSSAAPAGVVVHLPLSGGRQLAVWQLTGSNQIALHVAGYDATDSIGGTSVTDRNPKNGGLVRRDIFTSSAALDQHLQLTYGYLLSQITAKLRAAGRTSPTPRWYSDALTGTQRPAERTTDLHF